MKQDNYNEHKEIAKLIKDKLDKLHKENENSKEMEEEEKKFSLLYRLMQNPYKDLFENIDIETAFAILKDLGIPEDKRMKTYQNLLKENMSKHYILVDIDPNQNNEKER